ncbi:MAG TPA: hypothetical protein VNK04_04990 [Gemmataceae bacterium]|nr:hypothetical protein [Gemmataceae bacterium]
MSSPVKVFVLTAGLLLAARPASAAEPGEPLPAPRPLAPAVVPLPSPWPGPHPFMRRSRYEVWQYWGVDRQGFFKPLVVASPYGAYYLYNGKPYPWAYTHPLDWMPYVVDDVPFRSP